MRQLPEQHFLFLTVADRISPKTTLDQFHFCLFVGIRRDAMASNSVISAAEVFFCVSNEPQKRYGWFLKAAAAATDLSS